MSERPYKFARGRNRGFRKAPTLAAHSASEKGDTSCDTSTRSVASAAGHAVSPAVSPPVSPASSREQPTIETQGSKRGNQSGSQSNDKPNCYACKYRGEVPGSAHSSCKHPAFAAIHNDPLTNILAILGSVGRGPGVRVRSDACQVVGNPHGIRNGWFMHPVSFDPVWLESCTGYNPREAGQ